MISLFYLFTSSIGFVTVFLLLTRLKLNRFLNLYLVLTFFLISLRFLFVGIKDIYFSVYLSTFNLISYMLVLFVFVLLYLYFKNLIARNQKLVAKDFLHFIPSVVLYFLVLMKFKNKIQLGTNYILVLIVLYLFYYLFKSYLLLKNNVWNRNSSVLIVNQQQKLIKNWTKFLFVSIFLVFIRSVIQTINYEFGGNPDQIIFFNVMPCIVVATLFLKVLLTPEILYGYDFLIQKIENHKVKEIVMLHIWKTKRISDLANVRENNLSGIVYTNLDKYISAIEQVQFTDKTFKDSNFKMTNMGHLLEIPKSHLLFLYKHHCNLSFSEYKKAIRIKEAIRLIEAGYLNSNTIESLAMEVGFSSYSPFFTSFKNITSISPKEYYLNKD